MGRPALIALARACALASVLVAVVAPARADSRVRVSLPPCDPAHVDVALLAELLALELATTDVDGSIALGAPDGRQTVELAVDGALCDPAATAITLAVRDPLTGAATREVVELAEDADRESAARALALAIAERVRSAIGRLPAPPTPPHRSDAPAAEPERAPPRGPWSLGVLGEGRLAPGSGTWTLGLRGDLEWRFDPTWRLRIDVGASGSRGSVAEADVDLLLATGAIAIGATIFDQGDVDLHVALRAELGVVALFGTLRGGASSGTDAAPYADVAALLGTAWWLDRSVALTADLRVAALLLGVRDVAPSGNPIDLTYLTLDLAVGARFAL